MGRIIYGKCNKITDPNVSLYFGNFKMKRVWYSVHYLEISKCLFKSVLLKYSYPDADWSSQGTFSSF